MPETYDCIVLGVGGFGSSALYHLARRGVRTLGLEQFAIGHDRGSSHGETRIIRQAYYEHPDYVPLMREAYRLWRELEAEQASPLLFPVGLFLAGAPGGEVVPGTRLAAQVHNLPLEELTPAEARRRFPGFNFPEDFEIVFEGQAGYLAVEACVQAHVAGALRHGAVLRTEETVHSWNVTSGCVRVRTDRGEYQASRLVVTAGAWAGQLLADLQIPLRVLRKVLGWFPAIPGRMSARDVTTTWVYELPSRQFFYGFPGLDGETIKLAEHSHGEEISDPAQVDRNFLPTDAENFAQFLKQYIPGLDPTPRRHAACLYTMSPDSHFIIDRHPVHPEIQVATGFSGHGFKFTSVIGAALADLAMHGRTASPLEFLGTSRFRR